MSGPDSFSLGLGEAPRPRWVDLALPGAAVAQQAVAGGGGQLLSDAFICVCVCWK